MASRRARAHSASARRRGSLGARLVLILTAVGLVGTIAITLVLASIITPSFATLEARAAAMSAAGHVAPHDISILGRRVLLLAIAGSTLLLLLVLVVLRRIITRTVLRPLARVESHMQMVRVSGSLAPLEGVDAGDEIGSLGASFNAMLSQQRDLREQIEAQSFALGRSESTVAVMHNVRNALNPVTTVISRGIAQAPPIDRAMLDGAAAELAQDDLPPARRRKLAAFVAAAIEALEAARRDHLQQLSVGREAMKHVLDIIGQQQASAHERPPLGICDVTATIAQNAAIARYSGATSIAFSFPAEPVMVLANRVILSQVIGNLFANAAEAIMATGRGAGSIMVTIEVDDAQVVVAVRDDGEGFSPDVGATLFQRGFSTRAHKSGGLGLHWCANSMVAMDGSLRLESEGPGCGAVALLTLRAGAGATLGLAA